MKRTSRSRAREGALLAVLAVLGVSIVLLIRGGGVPPEGDLGPRAAVGGNANAIGAGVELRRAAPSASRTAERFAGFDVALHQEASGSALGNGGPFTVKGRIQADPHSPANLELNLARDGPSDVALRTRTDLEGNFRFEVVRGGRHRLTLLLPLAGSGHRRKAFLLGGVFVDRDIDLGTLVSRGHELIPIEEVPDLALALILVRVTDSGEPAANRRVFLREEGGSMRLPMLMTDRGGVARGEWPSHYGPLRIHVEDRHGNVLGSTALARLYPAGRETEVTIEIATGRLELRLPHAYEIAEDLCVQVSIEGGGLPIELQPTASISRRGTERSGPDAEACDAYFPSLPAGEFDVRSTILQRFEGLGWRSVGSGPGGRVSIQPGELAVLQL